LALKDLWGSSTIQRNHSESVGTLESIGKSIGASMRTNPLPPHHHRDIDVITLFAPQHFPNDDFEHSVEEWESVDRAILVVLPRRVDDEWLDRLRSAGADLCVVAPTPDELFTHVERARRRHRRACATRTISDDRLDALWRERRRAPPL
jgi:hypothetical protein